MVDIVKMKPREAIVRFYKQLMKVRKKMFAEDPSAYSYVEDLEQEMNWWLAHN